LVEQPRDPNDTSISVDDNLYLIADISETPVNEPITVVYKLYFSNNIGINNLSEVNKNTMILSQNIDIKNWLPKNV
jgi:hypothetical protein